MKIFEGKTPAERNKLIAAIVLGTLAVLAVGYQLLGFFPGKKTTTTAKTSPTPTPTASRTGDTVVQSLPPQSEIDLAYSSIPVVYPLVSLGAPDPGRNIFAFYEPPIPTPYSPTPTPIPEIKTPTPIVTPTPPAFIYGFNPPSVYAGSGGFTLDVTGAGFTPETRIFFNNNEMPTTFIDSQRLRTEVPSNFIAGGGQIQIFVRTPDGKIYSLPSFFNLQTPPRPQFQYVGIAAPKLGNNITAYIQETANTPPKAKRLDDRIGNCGGGDQPGCFKFVSISRERVIVQDTKLGFRFPVEMTRAPGQTSLSSNPNNPNFQNDPNNIINPTIQNNPNNINNPNCPPGIPCNVQRSPMPTPNQNPNKKDVDDEDVDDDGDN